MSELADDLEFIDDDREFNYADALRFPARRDGPPPSLDERRADERRRLTSAAGFDLFLALVVGVLCAIGLLMVYSASIDVSYQATGDASNTTYFFVRQARSMAIGLALLVLVTRLDYHFWRRIAVPMMLVVMLLLIAVLRFGETRFEAQRALLRGSFQPGELAKFAVVVYMAAWLASKRQKLRKITYGLLPFTVVVGLIAFLIILQPDLSTAASILATALSMFFIAGADWFQLLVIGGAMGVAGYQLATRLEYARQRLDAYFAAVEDLTQASDHVQQAVTAFINGGLTGVGLGEGKQKFANTLPFPHTDSIFAIIGEELGLLGTVGTIALFVALAWAGLQIARHACDLRGRLVATACTGILVIQAFVNIGGVIGVIPLTGKPLPFISNGGSSMVSCLVLVGLIVSVSRHSKLPETVFDERRRSWWVSAGPPTSDESSQAGEATPRSARHLGEGAPSLGGLTVVGGGRSAAARSLGARGASTASPTSPEGIRAARALSSRVGGGRVSVDASGRRRIDLGPSASERLRGPR